MSWAGARTPVLHFQIVPGHSRGEMKRCLPLFSHRGEGETIETVIVVKTPTTTSIQLNTTSTAVGFDTIMTVHTHPTQTQETVQGSVN